MRNKLEFKGTKGYWVVKRSNSKPAFNIVSTSLGEKYKVAISPYFQGLDLSDKFNHKEIEEAEANAKLIAAAPELLAALQLCLSFMDNCKEINIHDGITYHTGLEAIKKALE